VHAAVSLRAFSAMLHIALRNWQDHWDEVKISTLLCQLDQQWALLAVQIQEGGQVMVVVAVLVPQAGCQQFVRSLCTLRTDYGHRQVDNNDYHITFLAAAFAFFSAAILTFSACLAAVRRSFSCFFASDSASFSWAIWAFSASSASSPCFLAAARAAFCLALDFASAPYQLQPS